MPGYKLARWALAAVIASMPPSLLAQSDEGPILRPHKSVPPPPAAASATLLVMCDLSCNWSLDGEQKGHIEAGASAKAKAGLGQHVVIATTEDSLDRVHQVAEVRNSGQTVVILELKAIRAARLVTWNDPATGLMWARKDNGGDVEWQEADDYCKNISLGGYSGWRLPTIGELAKIYDQTENVNHRHIKGGIEMTGWWAWSNSPGNASGKAWSIMFTDGTRYSTQLGNSFNGRALCVRRSGE
jgi:hypothetical protein